MRVRRRTPLACSQAGVTGSCSAMKRGGSGVGGEGEKNGPEKAKKNAFFVSNATFLASISTKSAITKRIVS